MSTDAPPLAVAGLSHSFGARQALHEVSFQLDRGDRTVLLGLNGAGKTTLFSLITRLYNHRGGSIRIFGWEIKEKPSEALAQHPGASILVAAQLVADGAADALVSAGNTGASVLACARTWKRIPGVGRAALASVYPTEIRRGEKDDPFSLILDVGATLDVTAEDLVTFAIMGSAYAARVSKNPRPRVALLSNGAEAGKGPPEIVEAQRLLHDATELNFVGNVEGVDIPRGTADVVVCSGFVGNVVIKMLEGVSETIVRLGHYASKEKILWRAGLALLSGGISRLKEVTDWEQYGGAPVLGFDRLFIKAHGRSRARAIANAAKVAAKAVQAGLTDDSEAALRRLAARRAA